MTRKSNETYTTLLSIGGIILNFIWALSIGRTSLFQKAWKNKLDTIAQQYPIDIFVYNTDSGKNCRSGFSREK